MGAVRGRVVSAILSIALVGCAAAAPSLSPTPSLVPAPLATATLRPAATPTQTATALPTESAAPGETRPPLPPTPAGWTDPVTVIPGPAGGLDAKVDGDGGYHIVVTRDDALVYAFSADHKTWSTTTISPPAGRALVGAKLAIEEGVVVLAYQSYERNVGCVGPPPDGVYYRTRTLPDGAWSEPTMLGIAGDELLQFGVGGGILRAIVDAEHGGLFYERLSNGALERFSMDATGIASSTIPEITGPVMAVGIDGRGRIVGRGPDSFVMVTTGAAGLSAATAIPGTNNLDLFPVIALDGADKVHVLWTHNGTVGCGDYQPTPEDGTYHGTNATGTWVSERITTDRGHSALAVEPASGRLHAIVSGEAGIGYYTRTPDSSWTSGVVLPIGSLIRYDKATDTVLVVDVDYRYGTGGVSVMTTR